MEMSQLREFVLRPLKDDEVVPQNDRSEAELIANEVPLIADGDFMTDDEDVVVRGVTK